MQTSYGRHDHEGRHRYGYCSRLCARQHGRDHHVPVGRVRDRMVYWSAAPAPPRTERRRVNLTGGGRALCAVVNSLQDRGGSLARQRTLTRDDLSRAQGPDQISEALPVRDSAESAYFGRLTLQLSKNVRCFSNAPRLSTSAWSSDSTISERWPVSSACLTITRWRTICTFNSAMCPLAWARCFCS
jgi:hypothetical protein